jgi:hypothetical protein
MTRKRNLIAKDLLDRSGPYRPKIVQSKKLQALVADDYDDWYFGIEDERGVDGETESTHEVADTSCGTSKSSS